MRSALSDLPEAELQAVTADGAHAAATTTPQPRKATPGQSAKLPRTACESDC